MRADADRGPSRLPSPPVPITFPGVGWGEGETVWGWVALNGVGQWGRFGWGRV